MKEEYSINGNSINFEFVFDGIFTKRICKKVKNYDEIIFQCPITNKLTELPKHIKSIVFYDYDFPVDNLHNGLLELMFYDNYDFPLNNLPTTLKELLIPFNYKYSLDFLPDGLEILDLPNNYNLSLKNLPSSINKIIISYGWCDDFVMIKDIKNIDKILPNLKTVIIKEFSSSPKCSLEEIREQIKLDDRIKLEHY